MRQLAVRLHRTLLPLDVTVDPEAMGLELIIELDVQEILVVVQLRLGTHALVHQLCQVALLELTVIVVSDIGRLTFVLKNDK